MFLGNVRLFKVDFIKGQLRSYMQIYSLLLEMRNAAEALPLREQSQQ